MISCAQIVTVVVDYAHFTEGISMALRHGCRWVWMKTEEKKSPEAVATGWVSLFPKVLGRHGSITQALCELGIHRLTRWVVGTSAAYRRL